MNNKYKRIIYVILVIIWLIIIFLNSSNDGTTSDSKSKTLIEEGTHIVEVITNTDIDEQQVVETFNTPVRKLAHILEYLILSILVINTLKSFNVNNRTILITIIFCFIYALTDEYHQTFISDRTGQFTDVLIDTTGSLLGCLFYTIFCKIMYKKLKTY